MIEEVWMTATGELVVIEWSENSFTEMISEYVYTAIVEFGGECLGEL